MNHDSHSHSHSTSPSTAQPRATISIPIPIPVPSAGAIATAATIHDGRTWGQWRFSGAENALVYLDPSLQLARHRIHLRDCTTPERTLALLSRVPEPCRIGKDASDLLEAVTEITALGVAHGA